MNQQHIAQFILRIYAGFKWNLKIADRSVEDVNALIDQAIAQIRANIPPEFGEQAVEKFEIMRNRLSEFVVDGRVMLPEEPAQQGGITSNANKCQKCKVPPIIGHRPSVEKETEFFLLCPKCKSEGLASLSATIALENWNTGKVD